MSLRSLIITEFERVAGEHERTLAPISDEAELLDLGLDSLCFAIIASRLEDALGYCPFAKATEDRFPETFGDFVRFYENGAR
jgi:aryl carrier-like protein